VFWSGFAAGFIISIPCVILILGLCQASGRSGLEMEIMILEDKIKEIKKCLKE